MVELTLTLPDRDVEYINEQVASGSYSSAGEFVSELIENARTAVVSSRMAHLIREGMESGEVIEYSDEWWNRRGEEIRAEAKRRGIT